MATPQPLVFPVQGLNRSAGYHAQPDATTKTALNVRPHDAIEGKLRGGRRAGLSTWVSEQINSSNAIQAMTKATQALEYGESFWDLIVAGGNDVAGTDDNMVLLAGSDGTLITGVDLGSYPYAVARDADANMYAWASSNTSYDGSDGTAANLFSYTPFGTLRWAVNVTLSETTASHQGRLTWDSVNNRIALGSLGGFGEANEVLVLDANTGATLWTASIAAADIHAAAFDSDGNLIVGGDDTKLYKYDADGTLIATSVDLGFNVNDIDINPSTGELLVGEYGDPAREVRILSSDLSTVVNSYTLGDNNEWLTVVWTPDGDFVTGAGKDSDGGSGEGIQRITRSTGAVAWSFTLGNPVGDNNYGTYDLRISGSGDLVIGFDTTSSNTGVFVRDISDGSAIWDAEDTLYIGETHVDTYRGDSLTAATRETSLVVVSGGSVYKVANGARLAASAGSGVLTTEPGRVQAQAAYSKVFCVDGANSKYFDLADNTVYDWATKVTSDGEGTLQANSRLIALYRGRVVLSGVQSDPHNWYMSRVGDPLDWDYAPATTSLTDPVAGNNAPAGLVGDIVTALIPVSDDVLLFGCDSSIWQMTGDPAGGGAIDLVSDQTGIAFGRAWAKDPSGAVYFLGIDGVYRMRMGEYPVSITIGRLDREFEGIDLEANAARMGWDFIRRQLWVVIVPADGESATTVYVWDQRTDSWWQDEYPTTMGPNLVIGFDSDKAEDTAFLLGCRDGYIREVDDTAADDDGTGITSKVRFKPLIAGDPAGKLRVEELTAIMGLGSGNVDLRVYTGQTAEEAFDSSTVRMKKVLKAGRNSSLRQRVQAAALEVEIGQDSASSRWALERLNIRAQPTGRARRRKG